MAKWYHYVCMDCGYGGPTQDYEGYKAGRYACPSCGSLRFEVEDMDAAPLPDEDELAPQVDD